MDAIDLILLEAWNRVSARLKRDRIAALKRSQRRFTKQFSRPMREWCLVIRASDTRISERAAVSGQELEVRDQKSEVSPHHALSHEWERETTSPHPYPLPPKGEGDMPPSPRHGESPAETCPLPPEEGEGKLDPIAAHEPHTLHISGTLIRELTKPVSIPWPGVTYAEAARRLGRDYRTLYQWVSHGVFKIERYRKHGYPENGKPRGPEPKNGRTRVNQPPGPMPGGDPENPWTYRFAGGGRPYVWTPSPIDPNMFHGRTPHPIWGTLWQHLWENMPEEFEQTVQRVPRWREQKNKRGEYVHKFLGWEFVCPGLLNAAGDYSGCGKRCTYLYAPQKVWTLAQAILGERAEEHGFDMPPAEESGLAGQWHPGVGDPLAQIAPHGKSFACKHCWRVHSPCMANHRGWGDFIRVISGGLLTARDVKRPPEICPIVRKKRKYQWKRKVRVGEDVRAAVA